MKFSCTKGLLIVTGQMAISMQTLTKQNWTECLWLKNVYSVVLVVHLQRKCTLTTRRGMFSISLVPVLKRDHTIRTSCVRAEHKTIACLTRIISRSIFSDCLVRAPLKIQIKVYASHLYGRPLVVKFYQKFFE